MGRVVFQAPSCKCDSVFCWRLSLDFEGFAFDFGFVGAGAAVRLERGVGIGPPKSKYSFSPSSDEISMTSLSSDMDRTGRSFDGTFTGDASVTSSGGRRQLQVP